MVLDGVIIGIYTIHILGMGMGMGMVLLILGMEDHGA